MTIRIPFFDFILVSTLLLCILAGILLFVAGRKLLKTQPCRMFAVLCSIIGLLTVLNGFGFFLLVNAVLWA